MENHASALHTTYATITAFQDYSPVQLNVPG